MPTNQNSAIIYQGPSLLTGDPIVAIVTGLKQRSKNGKTGKMLQTWILHAKTKPLDAVKNGEDIAICGACPFRMRTYEDGTKRRPCYVNLGQAPTAVFRAFIQGSYSHITEEQKAIVRENQLRLGSYGDPAAVPFEVWFELVKASTNDRDHTGYTHQWDPKVTQAFNPGFRIDPRLRDLVMASADSFAEQWKAAGKGYRSFRVIPADSTEQETIPALGFQCPSDPTLENHVSCAKCKLCSGTPIKYRSGNRLTQYGEPDPLDYDYREKLIKRSPYILAHGPTKKRVGQRSARLNILNNSGNEVVL